MTTTAAKLTSRRQTERGTVTVARRSFVVDLPVEEAWRHLADVERWPTWATHLRRVRLSPPGELRPESRCTFLFKNGLRSTVAIQSLAPHRRWRWDGRLLWLTLVYDHRFRPLDGDATEITWEIGCVGFGAAPLGRLLAPFFRRNLDRTLPRLVAELHAARR